MRAGLGSVPALAGVLTTTRPPARRVRWHVPSPARRFPASDPERWRCSGTSRLPVRATRRVPGSPGPALCQRVVPAGRREHLTGVARPATGRKSDRSPRAFRHWRRPGSTREALITRVPQSAWYCPARRPASKASLLTRCMTRVCASTSSKPGRRDCAGMAAFDDRHRRDRSGTARCLPMTLAFPAGRNGAARPEEAREPGGFLSTPASADVPSRINDGTSQCTYQ